MRRDRRTAYLRRMRPAPGGIEIAVDELILRGFPANERYAIGDGLSSELGRLFLDSLPQWPLTESADLEMIKAGRINLASNAKPAGVGTLAAGAIFSGIQAGYNHG
jgi:hypothetical protein